MFVVQKLILLGDMAGDRRKGPRPGFMRFYAVPETDSKFWKARPIANCTKAAAED